MTRKLPVAQYSAKRESKPGSYVLAEVPLCDGRWTLWVDGNSKVTGVNAAITSGMGGDLAALDPFDHPAPNAFSLPPIATCPGSTATCRASCYATKIPAELQACYADNERTMHAILDSARPYNAARGFGNWIADHAPFWFRWHVAGDVFSRAYAQWIQDVCAFSLTVQHWIYTRSYRHAPTLARATNLTVNLSVDRDNYQEVRAYLEREADSGYSGHCRLCYLAADGEQPPHDLPYGSVIFPDYGNRGRNLPDPREHSWWQALPEAQRRMVCPADFFGQSREYRCGPCQKCIQPAEAQK